MTADIIPAAALAGSNSLADLAARINAEHAGASNALKKGLQHAIACGNLLIEAKRKAPRGEWLLWLKTNCEVSERTAQAYIRVAKAFTTLGEDKAQRVADLSFRDALNSLAVTGSLITNHLLPESYDRALQQVQDHDNAKTWGQVVRKVRAEDLRARRSLETPESMLPSPTGRKIRVARNPAKREWMLAIGPDISRAELKEKEKAARETAAVRQLQLEKDDSLARAAAAEAEAKVFREAANATDRAIAAEIKKTIGSVQPLTETYKFRCDEATDAELAAMPPPDSEDNELVDLLLAARGTVRKGLEEIERGFLGDIALMSFHPIVPGPDGSWTNIGSPERLEQIFPNWNERATGRLNQAERADDIQRTDDAGGAPCAPT
jgi:hypothetical protein